MTYTMQKANYINGNLKFPLDFSCEVLTSLGEKQATELVSLNEEAKEIIKQDIFTLKYENLVEDSENKKILRFLVALLYYKSDMVGYAYSAYGDGPKVCYLDVIYIKQDYANRGLGLILADLFIQKIIERHPDYLSFKAVTQVDNIPARKLLAKLGFEVEEITVYNE